MSSRNIRGKGYTKPPLTDDEEEKSETGGEKTNHKRRHASVYDAVAGRVTTTLPLIQSDAQRRLHARHHKRPAADSSRDPTLAPEEVLFRRAGAPIRYEEKDIYQAHEDLPDGGRGVLPDSDLLKTIHSYASHFYRDLPANQSSSARDGGGGEGEGISERSMDETALIAFGILLEEASREALGKRGDLVFTEGMEAREGDDVEGENRYENSPDPGAADAALYGFNDDRKYQQARERRLKRRRRASSLSA
ncbi:hypothetical protein F5Y17DRAFT_428353 [Xylariaceae sp. FL0594]|nr:hypothetical protein F5Y17DRAFT_428353 [Xylariaceae sp. FL0594]